MKDFFGRDEPSLQYKSACQEQSERARPGCARAFLLALLRSKRGVHLL